VADIRVTTTHRKGTNPQRMLTFKADGADITFSAASPNGSAVVGRAVMLSAAGTVRLTGAGSAVLGQLVKVEWDNMCTVMTEGVTELPKGDNAIAVGDQIVGDTLSAVRGYIRGAAAPGAAYAEAAADDSSVAAHKVLDATTATAIEVLLGSN
jgi:hypothetical protein